MEKLSDNMRRGLVDANPVGRQKGQIHCDWCEVVDSCFFGEGDSARFLGKMDKEEFWERLGDV
jgi:hypothetical protein